MTHAKKLDQTWLEWNAEHGSGGDSNWNKPEQGKDGKWYQYNGSMPAGQQWREAPAPPTAPLTKDLQDLGLLHLTLYPNYYVSSPKASPNADFSMDPRGNLIYNRYLQYQGAELPGGVRELSGIAQGGELDATERKRVLGSMGLTDAAGGAGDPYAGAREARAARAAAIAEAMNAIDIQTLRQKAALAGAQFAAPTDTGGYFPQLGPNSPLVRSGLADPMRFTPTPYNAQVGGDQAASDLAMLRSLAGVG